MVPICVGDRKSRGPSDHTRTMVHMSRPTPEKRKEWPARPGSGSAGLGSASPSPTGTMVPTVLTVPMDVKGFSRPRRRCPAFGMLSFRFRAGAAGTISPRRSRQGGVDPSALADRRSEPLELIAGATPCSASFSSVQRPSQPAAVGAARHSCRSYIAPIPIVPCALWFPPWFQAGAFGSVPTPTFPTHAERGDGRDGNNCWRSGGMFSFSF